MTQSLQGILVLYSENSKQELWGRKSLFGPKKLKAEHSEVSRQSWEHSCQVATIDVLKWFLLRSHCLPSWKQVMLSSAITRWRIDQRRKIILLPQWVKLILSVGVGLVTLKSCPQTCYQLSRENIISFLKKILSALRERLLHAAKGEVLWTWDFNKQKLRS